ncbi:unnamed protein product, partial [Callosobruchus maculatus]
MNYAKPERDDALKEQYGSKINLCKTENRKRNSFWWCFYWGKDNSEDEIATPESVPTNGLYQRRRTAPQDSDVSKNSKRMQPPIMRASAKRGPHDVKLGQISPPVKHNLRV